jgi:arylsulfatase
MEQARENKVLPIGAALWTRLHPEDVLSSPYTSWTFDGSTVRMPEFTAPALGRKNNTVTIDFECGADASGVLYALGGSSGGLTCYMDKGHLVFEYNLMIIDRSIAKSAEKIAPGKHTIVVSTTLKAPKPGAPADIVLTVDGKEAARTTAKMTVPAVFTASESFDVGTDLGSPVSRDYYERRPFKFDGKIGTVKVDLK